MLFIAFCFEYTRWLQSYKINDTTYFETYLPIQLDATCNGYQHLSMLSSDFSLAKELNLIESSWKDIPKDFYSFLAVNLVDYFRNKLKLNDLSDELRDAYTRLSNLVIQRSIINKAIMTIAYNVTTHQMIKYIMEHFEVCSDQLNTKNEWYQFKDHPDIKLIFKDFSLIATGLRTVLNNNFRKLGLLIKYLKDIAKICTRLNLVIPWGLPSGVVVRQSYLTIKQAKLRPFSHDKSSFILKIPNKDKYNTNKQIRAFMPNLVHSLDAASLALLTDFYFKNYSSDVKNIYAIHDCFAVTANSVESLMELLKLVYIKIYSEDNYLRQIDREIRQHVKFHYGKECFDDINNIIKIENTPKMKFPDIELVLSTRLDVELIKSSSYIVN